MSEQFFVKPDGSYYGGFGDGAKPPADAIEVPVAPDHGKMTWNFALEQWEWTQAGLDAKQRTEDLQVLRSAAKDIVIVVTGLIDALVQKGILSASDVEPIARQAYQDLKAIADRVKQ